MLPAFQRFPLLGPHVGASLPAAPASATRRQQRAMNTVESRTLCALSEMQHTHKAGDDTKGPGLNLPGEQRGLSTTTESTTDAVLIPPPGAEDEDESEHAQLIAMAT